MKKTVLTLALLCSLISFSQTPLTDANIHSAVDLWVSDQPAAEATYGLISNWDTSNITNMSGLFANKTSFNANIGNWDVSNVTDMSTMFYNASSFNQPIGNWDVSSVIDMSVVFTLSSFNQPIGNWNVSNVTNMNDLFYGSPFNQDINSWNVSNVTTMNAMFALSSFNQPLGNWDVSSVMSMSGMFFETTMSTGHYDVLLNAWASLGSLQPNVIFDGGFSTYCNGETARDQIITTYGWTITDGGLFCPSLTPLTDANIHAAVDLWVSDQPTAEANYGHISYWDTANITDMSGLFFRKTSFNDNINNWNVSSVTNMGAMFYETQFDQPIGNWDVSGVTNMSSMFFATYYDQDISNWDVSNVTDMSYMFAWYYYPGNRISIMANRSYYLDISNWDVSSVTNMQGMFADNFGFNTDISSWDVSNVTDMSFMFWGDDYGEFNQPIGNWDVSSVTNMKGMFGQTLAFNQPLGNWDVSNVTNMDCMFCESPFNQDISNWDVSSVTTMSNFFSSGYNNNLSTENYDALLNGWASLGSLQPGVNFFGGGSGYCNGETAREYIINTYGWTINDGGLSCPTEVNCLTVEDSYGFLGLTSDLNLVLENTEAIKGFQFDITFPAMFVFDPLDITKTNLPAQFQVSCSSVGGNVYRVIGFSLANETIAPGTSPVLTFPTLINEGTAPNAYPIPITNLILSDVNNMDITSNCPTDGVITVYGYPMGDNNGDTNVNILDILGAVDYIFDNPPPTFYFELADVNFDDTINVLDVLGIQDIILGTTRTNSNETNTDNVVGDNYLITANDDFSQNSSETIEIKLYSDQIVKGLEFDLVLPEGFTLDPAEMNATSRLDGFTVSAQEIGPNTFKVLAFSLSSATVVSGTDTVLNLPVFIEPDISNGIYPITFTNVLISDSNNTDVSILPASVGEITIGNTLGVEDLENLQDGLKLYPNPVQNLLTIDSGLKGNYQIYDINARLVGKGAILLGPNEVDTSMLQSGLYFMKIRSDKGVLTKKVIKK